MNLETIKNFYGRVDRQEYSKWSAATDHPGYPLISKFLAEFDLKNKKCLEIGAGKGAFQDLVEDYTGCDVASSLSQYYHKPFYVLQIGKAYPFADSSFDAIWTRAVHEHVIDLDFALREITRILRPNGFLLFSPAWQCRSWASKGYAVRPYNDLDWRERIVKASIPLRDSVLFRLLAILPKRIVRHTLFVLGRKPRTIKFRPLQANYEKFWVSDSDACNSIDPHDAILWFEAHGFTCINHPLHLPSLAVRTGPLLFRKNP